METEINLEMEKKQILFLQKTKNYHPLKFLQQFNFQFQKRIVAEIPEALNYSLPEYKARKATAQCVCLNCSKIYNSEQTAEEMGVCWSCHLKESLVYNNNGSSVKSLKGGRKKAEKFFPHYLGKERIFLVRKFFCENINVKFKMKNKAPQFIREHIDFVKFLSDREILSMLNINSLKDLGLVYKSNYRGENI
jgi:hypothetical protein